MAWKPLSQSVNETLGSETTWMPKQDKGVGTYCANCRRSKDLYHRQFSSQGPFVCVKSLCKVCSMPLLEHFVIGSGQLYCDLPMYCIACKRKKDYCVGMPDCLGGGLQPFKVEPNGDIPITGIRLDEDSKVFTEFIANMGSLSEAASQTGIITAEAITRFYAYFNGLDTEQASKETKRQSSKPIDLYDTGERSIELE